MNSRIAMVQASTKHARPAGTSFFAQRILLWNRHANLFSSKLNALVLAAAALASRRWQISLAGMTLVRSSMYNCIPRCPCDGNLLQCNICWKVFFLLQGRLQTPISHGSLQQEFADLFVFPPMKPLTLSRTVPCTSTSTTRTTLATANTDSTGMTDILRKRKFHHFLR